MNDLLHLGSAIYNHINTNGTIPTYYQKVPQQTNTPYCLVHFMNGYDEYTFDDQGLKTDYVIKIVSSKNHPEEAIRLYGNIHELFQDASLSISGYDVIYNRRESLINYEDQFHHWNIGGLYNIQIWKGN